MFSKFFIERPIFSIVIAVVMLLAGVLTVTTLPVSQYPDITPPTVRISATYPGADAETVAKTIAVPIEQQVNGIENMMYMSSNCGSDGSYSLTVTFEVGTDLDDAAVKVQNRVALANPQLPAAVIQQGVSVMAESSNIILFAALESDNPELYDALYLTNYANINIVDPISRVPGVGGVGAFGGGSYSMRVWLDPEKDARARHHATGHHRRRAVAEHAGVGRLGGRLARILRTSVRVHHHDARTPGPQPTSSET